MKHIYICVSAIFTSIAYIFNKPALQPISISNNNAIPVCLGKPGTPTFYNY